MVKRKLNDIVDESSMEHRTHKFDVVVYTYPVKNLEDYT